MKQLKLKNYFFLGNKTDNVLSFQDLLAKQMFSGKKSRARTRFLKIIGERIKEINEERVKLLEDNAFKNKKGEVLLIDKDGKETIEKNKGVKYKMKDEMKYQKEYFDYINEDYVIDVSPANQETIYGVRDIVLDSEEEFNGRMASLYEEICSSFEAVS